MHDFISYNNCTVVYFIHICFIFSILPAITYAQCYALAVYHSFIFFFQICYKFHFFRCVGKDILIDKFSFADFCFIRYSLNKFGSTLIFRKNLACATWSRRKSGCMAFSVGHLHLFYDTLFSSLALLLNYQMICFQLFCRIYLDFDPFFQSIYSKTYLQRRI